MTANRADGPRCVIIGAGISGILMGIKLRERGWTDFVILEKTDDLGGTWRDNIYPGVACDVAAHLYVYSFAPNPRWRSRYAKGADIWKYYRDVAERYKILPHIRYGQDVTRAAFDGRQWQVETADGGFFVADVVVSAVGRLHQPVLPGIPGKDSFAGTSCHSARWDASLDPAGKRVGLIGSGSSGTQIITALAGKVAALSVFQRTAQWVFPIEDTPVPWWRRLACHFSPAYANRYYRLLRDQTEMRARVTTGDPVARAARDQLCLDKLGTIRDEALRARLTPDYEVGCKRLVMSWNYYEAIQQPGVEVISDAIDHIAPRGVVTKDGTLHELDVLVFATGFDAHAFLRPMQVSGQDGISLDQVWQDLPLCYQSIAIPHMPNFFLINGPYSPGGSASVVGIVEEQVGYIMQLIGLVAENDVLIAPREEAARAWLDEVRTRANATVWASGGCTSWYLDASGTPALDPATLSELHARLAAVNRDDYIIAPRGQARQEHAMPVLESA